MFDWGAQAISDILEKDAKFGLYDALERIQERPWLIDGVDAWIRRIKVKIYTYLLSLMDIKTTFIFYMTSKILLMFVQQFLLIIVV